MNYNMTVKNWRWWVAMPVAILMLSVLIIPKALIYFFEGLIGLVRFFDVGSRGSPKFIKSMISWVDGVKNEQ